MYNNKDNSNTFAVYCHYFPNGKVYVGLTCHSEDIEGKRFGHDGCKYKEQPLVYRAIQKYGWDNIQHEIIARYISRESAVNIEKDLISLYRSNERKYGYNISPGGEEGSYHSEETKKKMSEQRRGKKKSEEHRRKIGESNRGKVMSAETKKKISEKAKGRVYDTEHDPRNIAILQFRIADGKFIARYRSFSEAAKLTGASRPHINECAKEKRRQVLDCIWVYEDMATDEYVQMRLNKARLHSLYKPVVISKSSDFLMPIYCENIAMAARLLNASPSTISHNIKQKPYCNGYYIKEVTVDEYCSVMDI